MLTIRCRETSQEWYAETTTSRNRSGGSFNSGAMSLECAKNARSPIGPDSPVLGSMPVFTVLSM